MSLQARQQLVSNPRLSFANESDRTDLLDPSKTSTWLIALLTDLVNRCPRPLLITAVNTDHPTWDGGPNGHGHNAGLDVDLWHSDWQTVGDNAISQVLDALAACPYAWTVGGGGVAAGLMETITWPKDGKFVSFEDNSTDHVHVQAANAYGQGLR